MEHAYIQGVKMRWDMDLRVCGMTTRRPTHKYLYLIAVRATDSSTWGYEANPSICECSTTNMTGGQTCDEDGMADITLTWKSNFEREAQTMRANEQWARANPRRVVF
jgi:hypothetical protein